MAQTNIQSGIGTLVNHFAEGEDPLDAHVMPIYQTSTFRFPDMEKVEGVYNGTIPGHIYTRGENPNLEQVSRKIAMLEGLDLMRAQPERSVEEVASARLFSSGMAAITTAILARVHAGDCIIVQENLFGATYRFLKEIIPEYGIEVVWLRDPSPEKWEIAFRQYPHARLAYVETPTNPTLGLVNLAAVAEAAHRHQAWLMVDNTFASPFCQRPLTFGADLVVHSTTKYLSGHGLVVGGVVVCSHVDFVKEQLLTMHNILGGSPSPFDAWLTNNGLKTYEVRMQRHCENALQVARWLEKDPRVARVNYPGLESHPQHDLAQRQMSGFGGMVAFEPRGERDAAVKFLNSVKVCSLAVSLGTTDSLVELAASMTHEKIPVEIRRVNGISEGLIRFSVGIENIEDILADLDQALS